MEIDKKPLPHSIDFRASEDQELDLALGTYELKPGAHEITFEALAAENRMAKAMAVEMLRLLHLPLSLLKGIDGARDTLIENTRRFAEGLPANNALLWGARGMGKSSLVKAVHAAVNAAHARGKNALSPLKLVEIHRAPL